MVGKPNVADTMELEDAAMTAEGLTALDQEREASMADEGGMSGAVMESQDLDIERDPTTRRGDFTPPRFQRLKPVSQQPLVYGLVGLATGIVIGTLMRRARD